MGHLNDEQRSRVNGSGGEGGGRDVDGGTASGERGRGEESVRSGAKGGGHTMTIVDRGRVS